VLHKEKCQRRLKKDMEKALDKVLQRKKMTSYFDVQIQGRRYKKLSIKTNQKEKRKRLQALGKRILFTTDLSLDEREIIELYDRDKNEVINAFKLSNAPDIIRFQLLPVKFM